MLLKTPLHEAHGALGAKMSEFAGYDMPLYYKDGVMAEHEWVRKAAGLFDVSHMGQVTIEGSGTAEFFEKITPSAFKNKKHGRAQYTVLTNGEGGIVDDLIVTRLADDKFFAVLNAGCKDKDIDWIKKHLTPDLKFTYIRDHALVAIQGPSSEKVLKTVLGVDTGPIGYMTLQDFTLKDGTKIVVSRLGYTGEDGFEISIPEKKAAEIWNELLEHADVKPIGLAARDSLRLEMGYCLYGHDIGEETSPVEADIAWIIRKDNHTFIGAGRVVGELEKGASRKRVGIKLLDKGVAREGAEIRNQQDEIVGMLTSGGFSPSLKESIGQGYISAALARAGEKIFVNVRGRNIAAEVARLPFIPAKTKRAAKQAA
ncbi:MAG: glycine cleavage system aminomethyltransferase GcvT [Alphaproteobacteria bacterium]